MSPNITKTPIYCAGCGEKIAEILSENNDYNKRLSFLNSMRDEERVKIHNKCGTEDPLTFHKS